MNAIQTLQFQDTQFTITDLNGKPWLRGLQVASALGYKNPAADITNLYNRNADEFTESMTQVVELQTAGGLQKVRVFSLRGCHLLGMLAKTAKAKEFRRWVLDILEAETEQADPTKINPAQKQQIRNAVKARVYRTGETFQAVYEKLHDLLHVNSYHEIQAKDFQTALDFLASIENAPAAPKVLSFDEEQLLNIGRLLLHSSRARKFMRYYMPAFDRMGLDHNGQMYSFAYDTSGIFESVQEFCDAYLPHVKDQVVVQALNERLQYR